LAIVLKGTQESQTWNERGLEIARKSPDPKAQALIPAMLNNSAWELHEKGEYQQALALFEEARAAWEARGGEKQLPVAHWSVARCLRSLGRHADALSIQKRLEAEHLRLGTTDGYVFEEIAENLAALGRQDEAALYFAKAHEALSADPWMAEHESDRLASLLARAHKERPG
ncbi:MAG TPA: tetratricopeptide repeat protein, partial [Anaerolineales bacterium]|nr:tetratricopeptide repeat protein [Anaerolineales bacterium]